MIKLTRAQLVITLSCVESEIRRVEQFVNDHGGPNNTLNNPHNFWLNIARDAQATLIKQQEQLP